MALPVTISSAADTFPDQNYYAGPFKAPNGAIYVVLGDDTFADRRPTVYKATDPTSSFTQQTLIGVLQRAALTYWCYLSGSEIYIASGSTVSPETTYSVFDTSTDSWTTTVETIQDTKNVVDAEASISIAVRSDGDIIVLYSGTADSDMGNDYQRVDYARKEASWTVGIDVGGTSPVTQDRWGSVIVRGSADNMHFFWTDEQETNESRGRSLSSTNSLSTVRDFDLTSSPLAHSWVPGVAWNDSGTWRITVPIIDNDTDEIVVVRWTESSGALVASPGTTVVGSPEDVFVANLTPVMCSALDGDGRMWLIWSGGGTAGVDQDLYRDDAASAYTSWSGETEIINTTTINRISCNIYPRDGALKLAFVYDEAGDIKYNEVSITAPTAPSFASANFPDQNYHIGPFSI